MATQIKYETSIANPNWTPGSSTGFWKSATKTVYTSKEWEAMTIDEKKAVNISYGTGTFADRFHKTAGDYFAISEEKSRGSAAYWRGHRKVRNHLISALLLDYTVSEGIRKWCEKNKIGVDEIRDIRSTTDFYVCVVMPAAGATYARLSKKRNKTDAEYELRKFCEVLMGVIVLAEQY